MSQSHTVRVTTTTTSSSSTAIVLNTGYLKTLPGLLKVAEFVSYLNYISVPCPVHVYHCSFNACNWDTVNFCRNWFSIHFRFYSSSSSNSIFLLFGDHLQILGCVYTGIVAYNFDNYYVSRTSELFFYLMAVTFLVCTGILLISCLISWSTGGIISKTIFVSYDGMFACWKGNGRGQWLMNFIKKSFAVMKLCETNILLKFNKQWCTISYATNPLMWFEFVFFFLGTHLPCCCSCITFDIINYFTHSC